MKENDIVLIVKTFWQVDSIHVGKLGILHKVPKISRLGQIIITLDDGYKDIVHVDVGGCVPASSLLKELF